jgi:hypothetical protein
MQKSESRSTPTTQKTTKNNPNQKNSQTHNPLEVLYKKTTTTQNKLTQKFLHQVFFFCTVSRKYSLNQPTIS